MKYKPNFNDPRVLSRIRHAYGFTRAVMSVDKPSRWATRTIDKYYGQQQHKLSQYLRNTLLICTNHNYKQNSHLVKEYKINPIGLNYLRDILGKNHHTTTIPNLSPSVSQVIETDIDDTLDYELVNQYCIREFGLQLQSLDFKYEDKSHRLWNPLQNVKKIYKHPILAEHGLIYHYDIQCCAPTLIYQYSVKCGNDLYLPNLLNYLNNKNLIRDHISNQLEVPNNIVKIIINALFCGARIGKSNKFAISQLLNHDIARITWLKEDTYINDLRSEIKTCWQYIEPNTTIRYITKNNKRRKLAMNSKIKWSVYFQQERLVLDTIRKYLTSTNNKHFLEHDGWVTAIQIDEIKLQNYIKEQIGYDLKLDMHKIDHNLSPLIYPLVYNKS